MSDQKQNRVTLWEKFMLWLKRDPIIKLEKTYLSLSEQALEFQNQGKLKEYNAIMDELEKVSLQIDQFKKTHT